MNRIFITGASRGIGRAIAISLAQPGRMIISHGRDKTALAETNDAVIKKGGSSETLIADLSQSEAVTELAAKVAQEPLDCLINNAAIARTGPVEGGSLEDWQETLAVNVTAPFILCSRLIPIMPKGSTIVNILSIASENGFPDWSSYCMSKFAMDGFSLSMREELREKQIRVINIYPGSVATDIWSNIPGDHDKKKMMSAESVAEAVAVALSLPSEVVAEKIRLTNLN